MYKLAIVVSGGTVTGDEYIPRLSDYEVVILSADGGYLNAMRLNLIPDICIGDFDTMKSDRLLMHTVIKYPPQKDDTDTMLCVKKAISMGCHIIYIYGALGGRFDHTIANIQTLEYAIERNVTTYIIDRQNIITMQGISSKMYYKRDEFQYFSILSISEHCEVSTTGLKYSLDRTTLTRDFPLGISNEMFSDCASVTVHSGMIMVVYSKDHEYI